MKAGKGIRGVREVFECGTMSAGWCPAVGCLRIPLESSVLNSVVRTHEFGHAVTEDDSYLIRRWPDHTLQLAEDFVTERLAYDLGLRGEKTLAAQLEVFATPPASASPVQKKYVKAKRVLARATADESPKNVTLYDCWHLADMVVKALRESKTQLAAYKRERLRERVASFLGEKKLPPAELSPDEKTRGRRGLQKGSGEGEAVLLELAHIPGPTTRVGFKTKKFRRVGMPKLSSGFVRGLILDRGELVFRGAVKSSAMGCAVLFDASGSMSRCLREIGNLAEALPAAAIYAYAGEENDQGYIICLAKNGRVHAPYAALDAEQRLVFLAELGGNNLIDCEAIEFVLARHPKDKIAMITDLGFSGSREGEARRLAESLNYCGVDIDEARQALTK